jgi:hypothetical protein
MQSVRLLTEPATRRRGNARWVGVAGLGLVALGSCLAWAEADFLLLHVTRSGTDGDGVLTLIAALVGAAMVAVSSRTAAGWLLVGVGAGVGAVVLYNLADLSRIAGRIHAMLLPIHTSVGVGLWLAAAGSAVAFVAGVQTLRVAGQGGHLHE